VKRPHSFEAYDLPRWEKFFEELLTIDDDGCVFIRCGHYTPESFRSLFYMAVVWTRQIYEERGEGEKLALFNRWWDNWEFRKDPAMAKAGKIVLASKRAITGRIFETGYSRDGFERLEKVGGLSGSGATHIPQITERFVFPYSEDVVRAVLTLKSKNLFPFAVIVTGISTETFPQAITDAFPTQLIIDDEPNTIVLL
jgi:hypothetical protein